MVNAQNNWSNLIEMDKKQITFFRGKKSLVADTTVSVVFWRQLCSK